MRRNLYSTLFFFVGLCSASVLPSNSISQSSPSSEPIPATLFGLHIHHAATTTAWPGVTFSGWRLWDAYVAWPNLEPHRGQWQFEMLDRYVSQAEQHKVDLLLPLGLSPTWASSRPTEKSVYQPGNAAEPRDLEDWRDYVRTVSTRYKGRIHEYEIWNEPNLKEFWSGDVAQMVELTKEASEIIHEIDPHATIVSPSATTTNGLGWLSEFLRQGGGKYVDVVGYHFYTMPQPPEAAVSLIKKVRQIMDENAVGDRPLWNTETGWAAPKPFPSEDLAASYVVRSYLLNWAEGVQRLYWYAWDNHNWVTIQTTEGDSKTLTSAGRAYQTAYKWLVGASLKECGEDKTHTWTCELERNGEPERLVWNIDHVQDFDLPATWNIHSSTFLSGENKEVIRPSIEVGEAPILLSSTEKTTVLNTIR